MGAQKLEQETLGQRIKRFRKELGLSQIDLAKLCGVSDPWISQIEQDKVTASAVLLNKIAASLKIPIRELLKNSDEQMELTARFALLEVLLETGQLEEAERIISSLESHNDLTESDSMKITVFQAECKYKQGKHNEALRILNPLVNKLESINHHDAHFVAWIRNLMGSVYFKMQDFKNAHYNFRKADDLISRFVMFDSLAARISYNVGLVCLKYENTEESIFYLEKSYKFFKENNSLRELAHTTISQGIAFQRIMDYEKALECFNQAKTFLNAIQNTSLLNMIEHTIASEITAIENPALALEQLQVCLDSFLKEKDYNRVVLIYSKMIDIHLREYDLGPIVQHIATAKDFISQNQLQQTAECALFFLSCAKYYFNCENFYQSIDLSINSSNIFGTIGLTKDQVHALRVAVDSYQSIGDLENALKLSKQCNDLLLPNHERGK